jgi:hypothetical protein
MVELVVKLVELSLETVLECLLIYRCYSSLSLLVLEPGAQVLGILYHARCLMGWSQLSLVVHREVTHVFVIV